MGVHGLAGMGSDMGIHEVHVSARVVLHMGMARVCVGWLAWAVA